VLFAMIKTTEKHIKLLMMEIDVGDQRTTISLSGASTKSSKPF
jgi:hypothetical protein